MAGAITIATMDDAVNKDIVSFLCHCAIPMEQTNPANIKEGREQKTDMSKMRQRKEEFAGAASAIGGPEYISNKNNYNDPSPAIKQEPVRVEPKIGRNDTCPCGSCKKYKNCHGKDCITRHTNFLKANFFELAFFYASQILLSGLRSFVVNRCVTPCIKIAMGNFYRRSV